METYEIGQKLAIISADHAGRTGARLGTVTKIQADRVEVGGEWFWCESGRRVRAETWTQTPFLADASDPDVQGLLAAVLERESAEAVLEAAQALFSAPGDEKALDGVVRAAKAHSHLLLGTEGE